MLFKLIVWVYAQVLHMIAPVSQTHIYAISTRQVIVLIKLHSEAYE